MLEEVEPSMSQQSIGEFLYGIFCDGTLFKEVGSLQHKQPVDY